jgi:hypothetical protein
LLRSVCKRGTGARGKRFETTQHSRVSGDATDRPGPVDAENLRRSSLSAEPNDHQTAETGATKQATRNRPLGAFLLGLVSRQTKSTTAFCLWVASPKTRAGPRFRHMSKSMSRQVRSGQPGRAIMMETLTPAAGHGPLSLALLPFPSFALLLQVKREEHLNGKEEGGKEEGYHSLAIGKWRRASRERGCIPHSKCSKCSKGRLITPPLTTPKPHPHPPHQNHTHTTAYHTKTTPTPTPHPHHTHTHTTPKPHTTPPLTTPKPHPHPPHQNHTHTTAYHTKTTPTPLPHQNHTHTRPTDTQGR